MWRTWWFFIKSNIWGEFLICWLLFIQSYTGRAPILMLWWKNVYRWGRKTVKLIESQRMIGTVLSARDRLNSGTQHAKPHKGQIQRWKHNPADRQPLQIAQLGGEREKQTTQTRIAVKLYTAGRRARWHKHTERWPGWRGHRPRQQWKHEQR